MLRNLARTALLAGATSLALIAGTPAEATSKHLTILASVPDLAFPFFVQMMGQIKVEANRLGDIKVIESDGERSSPKQGADLEAAITKRVDGIVINPNDFDVLAPALQEAIDSKIPAVTIDRRANVRGILAPGQRRQCQGRGGAGRTRNETVPERRQSYVPTGPIRREPRYRSQQRPP
jgi:inositol transport system substrate-binding protein